MADVNDMLRAIKQAGDQHDTRLHRVANDRLDEADRVIGQQAQLKILNDGNPVALLRSLLEATEGNPP